MSPRLIVSQFEALYLHDSMLTSFQVVTAEARCILRLSVGSVRSPVRESLQPLVRYAPALLSLDGVREIGFEGRYQLNATIVDASAFACSDGRHVEFVLELTGGHDSDAFLVKMRIVAKSFRLGEGSA